MKIQLTQILFLLLFTVTIYGQKTYTPEFADPLLDKYRWRHCKELSGKNFSCFYEGENGTMWFGIQNGVISYDGYKWTEYLIPEQKRGIANIRAMAFLGDTLFIAGNGIQKFFNGKWGDVLHPIKDEQLLPEMVDGGFSFYDLKASDNTLVGARTFGIYVRKNGQSHFYSNETIRQILDTLSKDLKFHVIDNFGPGVKFYFTNILDYGDKSYHAIFSSAKHMNNHFKFKLNNSDENPIDIINTEGDIFHIDLGGPSTSLLRPNGEIWVVSEAYDYGLNIIRNDEYEEISFQQILKSNDVACNVISLSDNSVLITSMGIIYRYYNKQWTKITAPDIPFESIHLFAKFAKNGELWLGDEYGEVYHIDYNSKHYTTYENLNYQFTNTDSSLWFISNDNKVVYKQNNKWYFFDHTDGLPEAPQTLYLTREGTIWCGGSNNQVAATAYLNKNKWIMQCHDSLSWGINYNAVIEDANGEVWFGGASNPKGKYGQKGGVIKIKRNDNEVKITPFYMRHPEFYSFELADNNTLYAGTENGLHYYKDGKITDINAIQKINARLIKTNSGSLWTATVGGSVIKYNGEKQKTFTFNEGLSSKVIFDIYAINDSSVWAATSEGYSYYNGHYWINELFPQEFNIGNESGKLSGNKENIWISKFPLEWTRRVYDMKEDHIIMENYFSVMYKRDTMPPETQITFHIQQVDASGNTNIEWTGIDYMYHTLEEKLLYSYRLNNQEWSKPEPNKHINLTELRSGDYVFEVKAYDGDMNFDPTPERVVFTVVPPVYKQLWFVAMILFFASTVMYLVARILVRNKKLAVANKKINKSKIEIQNQNKEFVASEEELTVSNEELSVINYQLIIQKEVLEKTLERLKETQLQLVQSEKMASVGILSAGIAHEINNPLNFIKGGHYAIEEYIHSNLNEHSEKLNPYFEIVNTGIERASTIVKSLNHFNRSSKNYNEKCDIHKIIDNCLAIINNLIKSNVEVKKQYTKASFVLYANDGELHQLLLNVLTNAAQAISNKGTITIKTETENKNLSILVSDTGSGMSEENRKKVIDPFFTTKDPGEGTGMGMSIAYKIVQIHNGNMKIESEEGKGTKIIINIPIKDLKG